MADYPKIVLAVWKDDLKLVRALSGEPDLVDPDGRTALLAAVIDSKMDAAQILIEAGADVNFQDPGGWSALHFAAQNNSVEFARLLVEAEARIDPTDSYGNTPLWRATFACEGDGRLIGYLREQGADPNRENQEGISPASLARGIANYEIAQFYADLPE